MKPQALNARIAHDTEVFLRRLFGYTDEQLAAMWAAQAIPNALIDGIRCCAWADARTFLEHVAATETPVWDRQEE